MVALQCDICGGKLMGRPGGIFECESCGMQYDTAWAKAKVQEIKGTVKVEGTVEVKGTVKLDGPVEIKGGASAENYVKRGQLALASKNWSDAERFFDDALNLDAGCVDAYLGKCCAAYKACKMSLMDEIIRLNGAKLLENSNIKNALQFMAPSDAEKFRETIDVAEQRLQERRKQWNQEVEAYRVAKKEEERIAREKAQQQKMVHLAATREKIQKAACLIAAGSDDLVGLKTDGTVIVASGVGNAREKTKQWEDVISVFATGCTIYGLTSDGALVTTAATTVDAGEADEWRDLVAVYRKGGDFYGKKADGTLISTDRRCDDDMWRDVVAVSEGVFHTVWLKKDGTVASEMWKPGAYDEGDDFEDDEDFEDDDYEDDDYEDDDRFEKDDEDQNRMRRAIDKGQSEVSGWRDIVAIAAGDYHTVGLKSDGTVVAVGENKYGQCNVSKWTDIVAVSASSNFTAGLKMDGTVVAAGSSWDVVTVTGWTDIVAIFAASYYTVGLKKDGTVLATGYYQDKVRDWKLFQQLDTLEQERPEAREKARIASEKREQARIARQKQKEKQKERRIAQEKQDEERRIAQEKQEEALRVIQHRRSVGLCQHCGGEFKGLFSKKCARCGKIKDY